MESTTYGSMPKIKQKVSETRETLSQLIAVNVNNLLLLSNGMIAGYPTILIPGLSSDEENKISIDENQISWIGSISFMTALIACFLSGIITHPIGRSRSIHIASPFLFASWLVFNFASEIWHLYVGLCLCGFTSSIIEAPILSYKAEISQPHLRGMLAATSTLSVIFGVLLQFMLGTFFNWRTAAIVSSGFPFIAFVTLFFIPESPQWLIMNNKMDKARRNLAWLRGWSTVDQIEEEFEKISARYKKSSPCESLEVANENVSNKRPEWVQSLLNYTKKNFLWPLALVSFIYLLANLTGLCTLQTYAVNIFASLQTPMDKYYATVILGITELIGCFISLFVVRYFGKRIMGCVSILGVALCNIIVGVYAYIIDVKNLQFETEKVDAQPSPYAWLPLCTLILMAFIGHAGIRVLPWILLAEIFSHETRAGGCGIGSAVYYLLAFFANKVFISMIFTLEISGTYWFYAGVSVFGFIIMYFFLPETEGKDLQEVINHFADISKLDNNIERRVIDQSKTTNKTGEIVETDVDHNE